MKRFASRHLCLFPALIWASTLAAQPSGQVVQSIDRIFDRSAPYVDFIHKVSKSLRKGVKEERDLYSTLSGSTDHLAVKNFVEEAAELQQVFDSMKLPQSKTDKRRIYAELKTKADYLATVQKAIGEATESAKWFSTNVPQPKLVSVGVVENLWLKEFPAANKAVALLRSAIKSRMKEIQREVNIGAHPSLDGESSGPFALFDLEGDIPGLEEKVWELLDTADSTNVKELGKTVDALNEGYHELLSRFRSINRYIETLQRAQEGLDESDRFLREKYNSTIADAVEYQKAIIRLGSKLISKKRELEENRKKKTDVQPNPTSSVPAHEQGAALDARHRSDDLAAHAVRAQKMQLDELKWQTVYDRYLANLHRSIGRNRADWKAVREDLADSRAGRTAYLRSFTARTQQRANAEFARQFEANRGSVANTLRYLDPLVQARLRKSGLEQWEQQERDAWANAVAYGRAETAKVSSSMMDKATGAAAAEFGKQAFGQENSDSASVSEATDKQNESPVNELIPKRQDPEPKNDASPIRIHRPSGPDYISRADEFDFRPSWDRPVRGSHVKVFTETGTGELQMGVTGSAHEIDLLRPIFMQHPEAVRHLLRENPELTRGLQSNPTGDKASEVRQQGWMEFINEKLFQ